MTENRAVPDYISLPEDATYADLQQAHETGKDSKGRTEEELYPKPAAQFDAAMHYIDEAGSVDSFKKMDALLSRIQADPSHDDKSELEVRTGDSTLTRERVKELIKAQYSELTGAECTRLIDLMLFSAVTAEESKQSIVDSLSQQHITIEQADILLSVLRKKTFTYLETAFNRGLLSTHFLLDRLKNYNDKELLTPEQFGKLLTILQTRNFEDKLRSVVNNMPIHLETVINELPREVQALNLTDAQADEIRQSVSNEVLAFLRRAGEYIDEERQIKSVGRYVEKKLLTSLAAEEISIEIRAKKAMAVRKQIANGFLPNYKIIESLQTHFAHGTLNERQVQTLTNEVQQKTFESQLRFCQNESFHSVSWISRQNIDINTSVRMRTLSEPQAMTLRAVLRDASFKMFDRLLDIYGMRSFLPLDNQIASIMSFHENGLLREDAFKALMKRVDEITRSRSNTTYRSNFNSY